MGNSRGSRTVIGFVAVLGATVLALSLAPAAPAAPTLSHGASPADVRDKVADANQAKGSGFSRKWRCRKGDAVVLQPVTCVRVVKKFPVRAQSIKSYVFGNPDSGWLQADCGHTVARSFQFGISASVSGEMKAWIFAKINISITTNLEWSTTTTDAVNVHFKVPPHTDKYCNYVVGVSSYKVQRRWKLDDSVDQWTRLDPVRVKGATFEGWVVTKGRPY